MNSAAMEVNLNAVLPELVMVVRLAPALTDLLSSARLSTNEPASHVSMMVVTLGPPLAWIWLSQPA